jgi:calpain-15
LEKAWAKIYGSYQRIEAGLTGEALPFLTGAPSGTYMHDRFYWNPDKLWELIENADKKGFVMTTSVASSNSEKLNSSEAKGAGLVDAHAYSLIAAVEIELGMMQKQKLLMIRNPWGFKEWNGKWGDSSNKWKQHPTAKQSIIDILSKRQNISADKIEETYLKSDSNDGCFWISFDDYTRFFSVTSICYTSSKFTNNWIEDIQESKFGVISLKVKKDIDSDCLLTLNQINHRHIDETMRGCYKYAPVKLMVAQV